MADALPRIVERDAPVGADHVAAGVAHEVEHHRRAGAEVDGRHPRADDLEDALRMGQRELAVIGGAQRAHPRVEHLHRVHAGLDLRHEVVAHELGEHAHSRCQSSGWPYISALVLAKLFEWPPSMA